MNGNKGVIVWLLAFIAAICWLAAKGCEIVEGPRRAPAREWSGKT